MQIQLLQSESLPSNGVVAAMVHDGSTPAASNGTGNRSSQAWLLSTGEIVAPLPAANRLQEATITKVLITGKPAACCVFANEASSYVMHRIRW